MGSVRDHSPGAQLGRIGTKRQEKVEQFAGEFEASQALEAIATAERRRGYRDL